MTVTTFPQSRLPLFVSLLFRCSLLSLQQLHSFFPSLFLCVLLLLPPSFLQLPSSFRIELNSSCLFLLSASDWPSGVDCPAAAPQCDGLTRVGGLFGADCRLPCRVAFGWRLPSQESRIHDGRRRARAEWKRSEGARSRDRLGGYGLGACGSAAPSISYSYCRTHSLPLRRV